MPFITSLLTALIALFIYHKTDKITGTRNRFAVRGVSLLIFVVAAIATVFRNIIIVSTGNVGVVEFFGQINNRPLNPGIHLVNPFSKVETYSTRLKDVKETIEATSQEGLAFNVDVSLQYRIEPRKAVEIYQNLGDNETEIVISRFRSIVREVTASYPAEAIYSTKRQEVASRIREQLSKQLSPLGFALGWCLFAASSPAGDAAGSHPGEAEGRTAEPTDDVHTNKRHVRSPNASEWKLRVPQMLRQSSPVV